MTIWPFIVRADFFRWKPEYQVGGGASRGRYREFKWGWLIVQLYDYAATQTIIKTLNDAAYARERQENGTRVSATASSQPEKDGLTKDSQQPQEQD